MEIRKCLQRKDGVKMVIIPKPSKIVKDDLVGIIKLNEKEVEKYVRRKEKKD